jgi:8-oxo-dGTP pyrophosphatase MutT (NUDIX family)
MFSLLSRAVGLTDICVFVLFFLSGLCAQAFQQPLASSRPAVDEPPDIGDNDRLNAPAFHRLVHWFLNWARCFITVYGPFFIWSVWDWYTPNVPICIKMWRVRRLPHTTRAQRCGLSRRAFAILSLPGRSSLVSDDSLFWISPALSLIVFALRWLLAPRGATAVPGCGLFEVPADTSAVVGLLVTPSGMLLASRGPATKPAEIIGLLAGIGGKVDSGESLEDALKREFLEEVSVDITGAQIIPLGVEVYNGTRCMHYIVYSSDDVTPDVPRIERSKVVSPGFYPINSLPYHDMIPELATLIKSNSDLLSLSVRLTGSSAMPTKWVQRRLDAIPDDFAMFMVNNKDSSCLLYSLAPQLPPNSLDFGALEAAMPTTGYSPLDLLTQAQLHDTAIWDCDLGLWSHGDPTRATIFLSYVRNGDFGHYDMLRPLAPGEQVRDYILYPNGRGAFKCGRGGADPGDLHDEVASVIASTIDDAASSADTLSLHDSFLDSERHFNLKGFTALAKYMRGKAVDMPTGQAAITRSVDTTYWGAAYIAVQGVAQRLNDFVTFGSRSDVFAPVEYSVGLQPAAATAKTGRVVAMLNNNVIGSAVKLYINGPAMTAQLDISARLGQGMNRLKVWFDLTARVSPPIPVLVDNMVPTQAPEKFVDLSRNIAGLFNATFSNGAVAGVRPADIANDLSRAVWSLDDRTGGDMSYIYERLIAGMCCAQFGAVPRTINAPEAFLRMFPTAASWAYIWRTHTPANGLDPNGCARFKGPDGTSTITLLPLGSYQGVGDPHTSGDRDYRVALHLVSRAYLGFNPNRVYAPDSTRRRNYFAANASYSQEIPYLTFLLPRTTTPVARSAAEFQACAMNPDSWKDALCFLLKNFGRSADFAAAMDQCTADFTRHMSPTQTMLPIQLADRFQAGPKLTACLHARLLTMRCLLPVYSSNDIPDVKDWKKSMLARRPTGRDLLDGSAESLARLRTVYTAATTFDRFPPVTNDRITDSLIDIDAEWHQFFAVVPTEDSVDAMNAGIGYTTSGMTSQELCNLRLWLSDDTFANRWLVPEVDTRPTLRRTFTLSVPDCDRITDPDERALLPTNCVDVHTSGYNMRRDHSLCTFDVQRTRLVTVPCGVKALRALCHGMELYHSDTMALNINDTLRTVDPSDILRRMFLASTVWRCCADSASEQIGLTGSRLSLALGAFETGNTMLDAALDNVDGHAKSGGMSQLRDQYVSLLSANLATCGYDLTAVFTARGATVEWVNFDSFRYINGLASDSVNLLFFAQHHIVSSVLAPGVKRIGGVINRRVEWMANQVNGDVVPWDSWVANSTEFSATELLGALRIAVSSLGYCLVAPASVFYMRRSTEAMPAKYPVLTGYSEIPPRRSDCAPVTPYYAVDPYSAHLPVLGYTIDLPNVDNVVEFLTPAFQYGYLSLSRTSARPPTIAYELSNYSGRALPNSENDVIPGYNAGVVFTTGSETFGGAASSHNNQMQDADNRATVNWLQYQPQAGLQMSGNWHVSRALGPMIQSLGIAPLLDARITQRDGTAIGTELGISKLIVKRCLTTGLWCPNPPTTATHYERFSALHPSIVRRAEVWATKVSVFQLPANHAPLVDVVPTDNSATLPWMNEISKHNYESGMAAGVFELPGVIAPGNPAVAGQPEPIKLDGFIETPDPYDARHMLEGFRASKRVYKGSRTPGQAATGELPALEKRIKADKLALATAEKKAEKLRKQIAAADSGKNALLKRVVRPSDSASSVSSRISVSESTLAAMVEAAVEARMTATPAAENGVGAPGKGYKNVRRSDFR